MLQAQYDMGRDNRDIPGMKSCMKWLAGLALAHAWSWQTIFAPHLGLSHFESKHVTNFDEISFKDAMRTRKKYVVMFYQVGYVKASLR